MINDQHNVSALKFFESYAKESEDASDGLSSQEIFARDKAFTSARAGSIIDGWIWNICWNAAKKYYYPPLDKD